MTKLVVPNFKNTFLCMEGGSDLFPSLFKEYRGVRPFVQLPFFLPKSSSCSSACFMNLLFLKRLKNYVETYSYNGDWAPR